MPGTRSVRPLWLAYELNLEVEVEFIDFSAEYRDSAAWRAISPAGKVPAMIDDDARSASNGQSSNLTMMESGAMIHYILERYAQGRLHPPTGTRESALFHQWCWFAEATLTRPLGLHRILRAGSEPIETLVAEGIDKARSALAAVEQALVETDYLVGNEFSAADVMMGYSLGLLERLLGEAFPNASGYLARMRERPALQRAMNLKP